MSNTESDTDQHGGDTPRFTADELAMIRKQIEPVVMYGDEENADTAAEIIAKIAEAQR